jgi:hypothetical protein
MGAEAVLELKEYRSGRTVASKCLANLASLFR